MTTTPPVSAAAAAAASFLLLLLAAIYPPAPPPSAHALGATSATIAVVYGSATAVCTVAAQQPFQQVQCWQDGRLLPPILPTTSFDAVSGGRDTLCGLRSGGFSLLCWNTAFAPKRIYGDASAPLTSIAVGDTQICGLRSVNASGNAAVCWRGNSDFSSSQIPNGNFPFRSISSGFGFTCGIRANANRVVCWGNSTISRSIQLAYANYSMKSIIVGEKFACGINATGYVVCKGSNSNKQLNVPANNAYEYRGLALGAKHSCAIRRLNRTVVCWGGEDDDEFSGVSTIDGISFESISAGPDFTCGLITSNFTVFCWGPGWPDRYPNFLPLPKSLPGPCVDTACECNLYPQSQTLCSGNGHVCRPCDIPAPGPPNLPKTPHVNVITPQPDSSTGLKKGLLIFAIVGSGGGFAGVCALAYLLWTGTICLGKKKIHNSVQPTIAGPNSAQQQPGSGPLSRSSTLRRQGSLLMRRQRSGTSSANRAEEFSFSELARATNDFSSENKIGSGSFGVVYRGKLNDGREVAIKRSENGPKAKKFQEKESAFESELSFLSRVHHKHLVRLVGFCEEKDERLLVYEYMKNGALHDHLHGKYNVEKSSSVLNSWKMRIKVALGGARGVEYLHSYAVPPIIHRDIKSSNILLDENWDARVSDFGLSLMGPPAQGQGGGELGQVLDSRVGPPGPEEAEAVELVAYTAVHCVHLEGKDRPTMSDVVANLERALGLCEGSHGSISSGRISVVSD
ncbi:Putative serine/threonine-protein kinase-like protein CCR3 [Striga hermonthica]|uniref:non-specific serine/threonine protein kinase n=1 Tax=Striga hermonthica TaxID=68872 RepID=A0A9N7NH10_STRHE|nr:Putative serine/threonine-protein kinase-like protein CCR3 [Striga hermonthica]